MIISEVGLNHLGNFDIANNYVDSLLETDVDAITFQIREPSFYIDQFKDYTLTKEDYSKLKTKVNNSNKKFGLAISEIDDFSCLNADFYKILSKDLDNLSFIDKLTDCIENKTIYFSTGLSSFDIIENTLDLCNSKGIQNYRLIHTRLSNSVQEVNLKAINTMKNKFGNIIAFGNHCKNARVMYAAVAYEPTDYYFYVKSKNQFYHPDDLHAIYLRDVQEYCMDIKDLIASLGNGKKNNTNNNIKGQK